MTRTAEPIQEGLFKELDGGLDLRSEFQSLWQSTKKLGRFNPHLRRGFENLVERHRLHEILKIEQQPGAVRLTLANLWRLTRLEGRPGLLLHTFDLAEGHWREQDQKVITWFKRGDALLVYHHHSWNIWPEIYCQRERFQWKIILTVWLNTLCPVLRNGIKLYLAPGDEERFAGYIFRRLSQLPREFTGRVIDAAFQRHIWNPELLSLLFPLRRRRGSRVPLSFYLAAQAHKEDLTRINRESPDFMPLLNLIPPAWWSRRDLLQDKVLRAAGHFFTNFSPAGLRWLRRAPAETLDCFQDFFSIELAKGDRFSISYLLSTAEELAEVMASLPPRAVGRPEFAETAIELFRCLLLKIGAGFPTPDPILARRLVRLLARHITARWAACEQFSKELLLEMEAIIDWLRAEGFSRGLPDKNSTWRSLKRRSDKWHEEIPRRQEKAKENAVWESLLGEMTIGGLKIKPLVTGLDLYNEGREMRHCVSSYTGQCLHGGCRVFSLVEADGTRSTLSLLHRTAGGFVIGQHKGQANGPVSPAAAKAAWEVCRLYTLKHLEAAKTEAAD